VGDEDLDQLPEPARAFVRGEVDLLPTALDARAVEALVAVLVARGDAARLSRLAEAKDKALAKPARRGLHLLRTRGVQAPAPEKREFRVHGPHAEADVSSLASLIDGRGERIVWFLRPAEGGYDLYQAELSETRGLIGFQAGLAHRKEWRAHAKKIRDNPRLGAAEIPSRHARWLIEEAYQRTLAAGRVPPEAFAASRLDLGHVDAPERHPALDLAPPLPLGEVRARLASLHQLPELASWIPPEDSLRSLDLELGQIATSRLVVEPRQRMEQVESALLREADRALTPAWRALLAERLHETALLLHAHGRTDEARLATAAAALTLDESVGAADNPFVRRLFEKVVAADRVASAEPSPTSPLEEP
jgi:hypothetical protein